MKFHEYKLSKHIIDNPEIMKMSAYDYYDKSVRRLIAGDMPEKVADVLFAEHSYVDCKRPFYHVYPSVEKCLENTSLNFDLRQIGALPYTVAMCFAVGHEPRVRNGKVASMLVEHSTKIAIASTREVLDRPMLRLSFNVIKNDGNVCFSSVNYHSEGLISNVSAQLGDNRKLVSLAVGVSLLANDERFAEPILLKRDQDRTLDSDGVNRAIERARNRGLFGFSIGKGLEVSPHMRVPHFAIRWTGKGAEIPRLVPVKGCVVNRNKLFPIPTGYIDE